MDKERLYGRLGLCRTASGGTWPRSPWNYWARGGQLAETLRQPLCGGILGDRVEPLAKELFAFGADRVYLAEHEALREFTEDAVHTGARWTWPARNGLT